MFLILMFLILKNQKAFRSPFSHLFSLGAVKTVLFCSWPLVINFLPSLKKKRDPSVLSSGAMTGGGGGLREHEEAGVGPETGQVKGLMLIVHHIVSICSRTSLVIQ